MTPDERRRPELLNASRQKRVAGGSGTRVTDLAGLLARFKPSLQPAR